MRADFFAREPPPKRAHLTEVKKFERRADAIGQILLYAMAKNVPEDARLRIHLFEIPDRERRTLEMLAVFVALCGDLGIEVTCEPVV